MNEEKNFDREFEGVFSGVVAVCLNYAKGYEPKYLISRGGVTYVYRDRKSFIEAFKRFME